MMNNMKHNKLKLVVVAVVIATGMIVYKHFWDKRFGKDQKKPDGSLN